MTPNNVLAFNTARWNKTVTEYPWPGPKWMKENQTVLNNFTCYFKVIMEKIIFILHLSTVVEEFQAILASVFKFAIPGRFLPYDMIASFFVHLIFWDLNNF